MVSQAGGSMVKLSRRYRIPCGRGWIRTNDLPPLVRPFYLLNYPTHTKSGRRDLNPRHQHGKLAFYR